MDKSPWHNNAIFIFFCHFSVPSLNSASFSEFSCSSPFPPPFTKLKLGKNSGYTRPTLFVGWGEGLDLCELVNAPKMQKCPGIFLQFSLPPPFTKLKLRKNSGYTRPTLFVGWGEGLDLCELVNAPEMQKCPKTFVDDCRWKAFNRAKTELVELHLSMRPSLRVITNDVAVVVGKISRMNKSNTTWNPTRRERH